MKTYQFQSSLNAGVLSPKLNARIDIQQYYNGLSTCENALPQTQGGAVKRDGMKLIDTLGIGNLSNLGMKMVVFGDYLLVVSGLTGGSGYVVYVYLDDVLQTNINGSGNDYFTIALTTQYPIFDYAVSSDGVVICNGVDQPVLITTTAATTWAATAITFSDIPNYDFNDGSSPTPTSAVWDLTLPGGTSGDTARASIDGIQSEAFPISSITADTAANIRLAFQQVLNNYISGDVTCVFKAGTTFTVTFANGAADDYESVNLVPEITAAAPVSTAPTNTTPGVSRKEPVWSATRGWPYCVEFHENRLVFAATTLRPQSLWMSRTGEYFSFKNYRSLDNEAISVTLNTNDVQIITGLHSDRHLCVFTDKAEYYCPQLPVTPVNVAFPSQSSFGSVYECPTVSMDNRIIFSQSSSDYTPGEWLFSPAGTGGAIRQFVFSNDTKSYNSDSLSLYASHLMRAPVAMAASLGDQGDNGNRLYVINANSSIDVMNSLGEQGVLAWSTWVSGTPFPDGTIPSGQYSGGVDVAVYKDNVYFLMSRQDVGGVATLKWSLEKVSPDVYLDCYETGTQASSTTVLVDTYLNGFDVTVIDDVTGTVYDGLTVAAGAVTTPAAVTDYIVGIAYEPTIKTMPLNVTLQDGPHAGEPKRVVSVSCYLLDSQSVTVNGVDLIWPTDDSSPVSGRYDVRLSGWSVDAYVTISQTGPYPMNILDIGVEIDA